MNNLQQLLSNLSHLSSISLDLLDFLPEGSNQFACRITKRETIGELRDTTDGRTRRGGRRRRERENENEPSDLLSPSGRESSLSRRVRVAVILIRQYPEKRTMRTEELKSENKLGRTEKEEKRSSPPPWSKPWARK